MVDGESLERYTFDGDGRVYTDGEVWLPSVSTVLDEAPTPPGLQSYFNRTTQAERDEKTFYTQNRGTLLHYYFQRPLVDEEFWSDDEQSSEDCLRGKREHDETGLTGDYETWQDFQSDKEWAMDTWDLIRRVYDIHAPNVLDVELFVQNREVGYAGQFDLLYVDGTDVVLADFKTGKHVYDSNLTQLVAYKHAVEITVDRMQIIRINPDTKTWEVYDSDADWTEGEDECWETFKGLRNEMDDERIQSLRDQVDAD